VELVRRTRPNRRHVLVDAGCGIGTFLKRFGRRYGEVHAFDFAGKMVERSKRRCVKMSHVHWQTLGLEDAAAAIGPVGDLTVCLNVITSTDADLRRRQWKSLAGLARPGGHVLVVVPSVESAVHVMQVADETDAADAADIEGGLLPRGDSEQNQKHYTRDEMQQVMRKHGLRVVVLRRIHYPWSDEGLDDYAARRPWSWVCLARKARQ
jgi:SAM-dependent methyltransferase